MAAEPQEVGERFEQAKRAILEENLDAAIAGLDEVIRLEPREAKFRGLRGVAWLRKGDYARGAADLKAAIALNPGDVGIGYQPTSNRELSPAAVQHGRRQVARMLEDRPAMAAYGKDAAFLGEWAARKFAGEDFGDWVDWDPSPPWHSDAEHLAPGDGDHAAILVEGTYTSGPHRGQSRSFEELWAGAVYELHNVTSAREFVRLNDAANEGNVSKEEFVGDILKYELLAAQRTRAFYVQVFLPWAAAKKLPTHPSLWFCDWWDTPESVLKSFPDKSAYPWRPYARNHDWATVHRYWRDGMFKKANALLGQMQGEKGYEEEQSDVAYWRGRCLAKLEKTSESVAAFSEAIHFDPENGEAYRARGEAYLKLGEEARAQSDLAKAKELEDE